MKNFKKYAVIAVMAVTTAFVGLSSLASAQEYRIRVEPIRQVRVVPGHWEFNGSDYIWIEERRIEIEQQWIPGHWEKTAYGLRWIDGHWE